MSGDIYTTPRSGTRPRPWKLSYKTLILIRYLLTYITRVKFQATEMLYHDSDGEFQSASHGNAPGA